MPSWPRSGPRVNLFFIDQTAFRVGPLAFEKSVHVAAAGSFLS